MKRQESERGQVTVPLVFLMAGLVLPAMGFAVDMTNVWMHSEMAQTAADAACQAGAMDMNAGANGTSAPNTAFTSFVSGTANNCAALPGASVCKYAAFNGYSGTGFSAGAASNSVSWTFPSAAAGVTAPSTSQAAHPFLKVVVEENVKTWFLGLVGKGYQPVSASCTCGLTSTVGTASMIVLDPYDAGSLIFGGGAQIQLTGGGATSIVVNSTSTLAVECSPSGEVDLSGAGASGTGASLATVGGPNANPTCWGSPYQNLALNPGTTGSWKSGVTPVSDPYANLAVPRTPASASTSNALLPHIVSYGQDGCPDHNPTNYFVLSPIHSGCVEMEPGYYPYGMTLASNDVVIFKPGLYFFGGSLSIGGAEEVRMATPCVPSCSSYTTTTSQQTDGMMMYFSSGQLMISGGSGQQSSSRVDPVNTTSLTCDGSSPPSAMGAGSTVNGNVLVAMCAAGGTYWDSAGDTSDSRGSPGSRGILIFQGHNNPAAGMTVSAGGQLSFSGVLYYHSTGCGQSMFAMNGAGSATNYVMGNIVADQVMVIGAAKLHMQLMPSANSSQLVVGLFN